MAASNPPVNGAQYILYVALQDFANPGSYKANPTLASGDVKVSIDGGAFANIDTGGTLPAVTPAAGIAVKVTLSGTQMTGDNIFVQFIDQTNPKEWADYAFNIQTVAAIWLTPTTAGRTLDVSAGGEAGVDWGNVGSPTTAVGLSGTTISTTQAVASVSGAVGSVSGAVGSVASGGIAAASFAAGAIDAAAIANAAIDRATFAADTGLQTIRSNTAAAGAAGTITLDAAASSVDDFYNDTIVLITGGTGVGQVRRIRDYVGGTQVATVVPNWATNPNGTSTFAILSATSAWDETLADHLDSGSTGSALNSAGAAGDPWATALPGAYAAGTAGFIVGTELDAAVSSRLAPTAAGRTLDVAATGEAGLDFDNIHDASGAHTLTNIRVPNVTLTDTVTTYTSNTPQTGDSFGRIGAAGAGLTALGDTRIAHLDADVTTRLAPTVAARTLDVSAGGEAGVDWGNVGSPTTTNNLSGTTVKAVTDPVTAGTVSDKTGYALTAAYDAAKTAAQAGDAMTLTAGAIQSIWDRLTSALTTVGSIGKLLVDNVNATISSRLASASISLSGGAVTVGTNNDKTGYALTAAYDPAKTAAQAGDAMALTAGERTTLTGVIWDHLLTAITTVGSIGKLIKDNLDAAITSRLASGSYVAPDNATITSIKTDTGTNIPASLTTINGNVLTRAAPGDAMDLVTDAVDANAVALSGVTEIQSGLATAASIAALNDISPSEVENTVWDAPIAGHLGAGTTGAALNGAGSAGDPWTTPLPGAYGAGTAGNIVGINLDAPITSRSIPGAAMTLTAGERNSTADALLDRAAGVEAGLTPRQAFRLFAAALMGKVSGAAVNAPVFRDTNDTKDRITATTDANGNRTAVTLDGN